MENSKVFLQLHSTSFISCGSKEDNPKWKISPFHNNQTSTSAYMNQEGLLRIKTGSGWLHTANLGKVEIDFVGAPL